MQPHRPAIAVVTPSILTGLGLESILRRIIPMAEVEVYDRFERFAADRPDRFFHYFVASQTFVEHNAFFLERRHKSILLTDGAPQSTLRELHCLDIARHPAAAPARPPRGLSRRDGRRISGHAPDASLRTICLRPARPHDGRDGAAIPHAARNRRIAARRGGAAQQADRPTARRRPDDGHLPPPQPRPQARHPLRGRTDDLRRDQRVRRRRATGRT